MIWSFIFWAIGIPYPKSGGLGALDVALAEGGRICVRHLATAGLVCDGAVVEGFGVLATGRARRATAEEGFVMLGGW